MQAEGERASERKIERDRKINRKRDRERKRESENRCHIDKESESVREYNM